ncbi:hypothetical protein BDY19DRAFT_997876 [Irpex rosettiformis]|uniref:Uncharacterized protein n=1 Tax=Irpex rosettiformis TaxID=378272 RepID=A0ACB8TR35_9APHY|nr:hypothetical protein BDY19DRAFT_997876 [Irpex rosettiformis]
MVIIRQDMFALRKINQMKREMCSYPEWELNVEYTLLKDFEDKVKWDVKGSGPYPSYLMPSPTPSPMLSTTPYTPGALTPALSFVTGCSAPLSSPPKHSVCTTALESSYISPPAFPSIPDTSEASCSASMSTSSVSLPTPQGQVNNEVCIASPGGILITVDHHHHVPVHSLIIQFSVTY